MDPVPTSSDPMGGKMSVTLNGVTIPSFMLGPISPSVAQALRKSDRLSGSTSRPSGLLDDPSLDITFYPNKWSDLQYFMPDNMEGESFVLGGGTCTIPDDVPVVFHYECDEDESRDMNVPAASIAFEDKSERNANDDLAVTIHIYPQPNALGQVVYGPMPTS